MTNDITTNGHGSDGGSPKSTPNFAVKTGLAKMLKGGVIMDVINAEQVLKSITPQTHITDTDWYRQE